MIQWLLDPIHESDFDEDSHLYIETTSISTD